MSHIDGGGKERGRVQSSRPLLSSSIASMELSEDAICDVKSVSRSNPPVPASVQKIRVWGQPDGIPIISINVTFFVHLPHSYALPTPVFQAGKHKYKASPLTGSGQSVKIVLTNLPLHMPYVHGLYLRRSQADDH